MQFNKKSSFFLFLKNAEDDFMNLITVLILIDRKFNSELNAAACRSLIQKNPLKILQKQLIGSNMLTVVCNICKHFKKTATHINTTE